MKKSVIYLCAGILVLGLTACGDGGQGDGSSAGTEQTQGTESAGEETSAEESGSQESSSSADTESDDGVSDDNGEGAGLDEAQTGWSEEMTNLRTAAVEAVGQQEYWPDMPMEPDMLETFYGITADMYDDFMAESPMISANVDTLIIVRPKADKGDAVLEALNAYREALVADTMQYPQNLGKIQASKVEKIGDYVIFVQLGGSAIDSDSEEEALTKCQNANQQVLDAIRAIAE